MKLCSTSYTTISCLQSLDKAAFKRVNVIAKRYNIAHIQAAEAIYGDLKSGLEGDRRDLRTYEQAKQKLRSVLGYRLPLLKVERYAVA